MTVLFDAITPVPGPDERGKAEARLQGRRERQQRTAAVRRQHLLDAAWALLVEVGPQSLNMRDLGARAGYTAGALYTYFPSRDHLLDELRQRFLSSLADRVARASKQAKKAVAANLPRVELKEVPAEPLSSDQRWAVFERGTQSWWQALSNDPGALGLMLAGRGANALPPRSAVSDEGPGDLLAELSQATQACTLALEEAGLAASEALSFQEHVLCFGVGLLLMQQSSLTTPSGRAAVSHRFVNAVRTWQPKVFGEENGKVDTSVDADDAQVDLF